MSFRGADQGTHLQRLITQAVPLGQQQHIGTDQHVGAHRLRIGQLVIGRHRQHEVLGEEGFMVKLRLDHRQGQQTSVQATVQQALDHLVGLLLHPQQLHVGESSVQRRHHVGQQVGRQGGEHPHSQGGRARLTGGLGQRLDLVHLHQHPSGVVDDQSTDRRGHHLAGCPLEQLDPERILQLAQL